MGKETSKDFEMGLPQSVHDEEHTKHIMTPEEFAIKMQEIHDDKSDYKEGWHLRMDELMCELLRDLGYADGIEIFMNTPMWYS